MDVLVIGGGGREHGIIIKLEKSKLVNKLYCTPGNGGISKFAKCFDVKATDIDGVINLAQKLAVDLVVVAPDDPLVLGMVDALNAKGIKAFGPSKNAAQIEGSKVFSKNLMKKYGIPTASYEVFSSSSQAISYIEKNNVFPIVIKADGLALGKGVIIAENFQEAKTAVNSIMEDKMFGESGKNIVVEEFMTGPEVSVLAFCDGKTIKPMVSAMDHKRAYDGDEGLNTGGMGTIAPNPFYTKDVEKECMEKIFLPTVKAMQSEGCPFKGCIFFGLMITPNGTKVIEYNCRFGDPETQVVLPLLDGDLAEIFLAVCDEKLDEIDVKIKSGASACVVMASGGYPVKYQSGYEIFGLDEKGQLDNSIIYHAGTKIEDGKFVTGGGRVLGVTCLGENLENALQNAYKSVDKITFDKAHFRKDIGKKALTL